MKRGISRYLNRFCPYSDCSSHSESPKSCHIVRFGSYFRADQSKSIPRFRCLCCKRTFSTSRLTACFNQKKRSLNSIILKLLCSGVSQRRIARILQINYKTVVRKFLFLAEQGKKQRLEYLESLSQKQIPLAAVFFDEMESFERSKCLPLSIPLAVMPGSRKILSFRVASMPAKGPLAEISRKKYGKREDLRAQCAASLFGEIRPILSSKVEVSTDENPKYPGWLSSHLPNVRHKTFKGRRGCVVGQGELKKIGFDPLFDLNHTCAMIRANVNRLFRRTWCTTKRADRLEAHVELYAQYHNTVLTS
jgi:transposase-like protein